MAFNLFRAALVAVVFILFTLGVKGAEDAVPKVPLPQDAQRAVAAYESAVKEIEAKALKAKTEAIKACDTKLMAAMKAATQRGDLDVAMALKAKWTEICGQVPDYGLVNKPKSTNPKDTVLGDWDMKTSNWSSTWSFMLGGVARTSQGATGTWSLDRAGKTLTVTWINGLAETMSVPEADALTTVGVAAGGAPIQFTRKETHADKPR